MHPWRCCTVLSASEVESLHDQALRILEEVGLVVENEELLDFLSTHGAKADKGAQRVRFPRAVIEDLLATASDEYDQVEGLEVSCTLPYGKRREYARGIECTAGSYPQHFLRLDGEIVPHTTQTSQDMTRLADCMENIDRLGVMGVPSDTPERLGPLYMRYNAWKFSERKPSGCGEVYDPALIPYIVEMGEVMAAHKGTSPRHYTFAEVELKSPLHFTRVESRIFVDFWKRGLLAGVGFMDSCGGSSPVTLAGTVSLMVAQSLFVSLLYRHCYGVHKLWLQCNGSVLDMRRGMFPFGRPERALLTLALGDMARFYRAGLWPSSIYADAKVPSCEAGMQAAFNTVVCIMAGALGLECFGLLSGGEIGSPVQLVIDNEYVGALKRFVSGFEMNEETLAFDLIRQVGPGGVFTAEPHTARHYRQEHWQPALFSREAMNAWIAEGHQTAEDKACEIVQRLWAEHHPQNIDEDTDRALLAVIQKARKALLGNTAS